MAARFREVAPYRGIDENLPSGGQGMVIPSGGSNLVILQDGKGLKVQSTLHPKVRVYEFTNQEQTDAAKKSLESFRGEAAVRQRFLAYLQDRG